MKGGIYAKTLTKFQVRGIFPIRDIRRNVLLKRLSLGLRNGIDREGLGKHRTGTGNRGGHKKGEEEEGKEEREEKTEN